MPLPLHPKPPVAPEPDDAAAAAWVVPRLGIITLYLRELAEMSGGYQTAEMSRNLQLVGSQNKGHGAKLT